MLKWFTARYTFDYFLRMDDDYFLCLDRLLFELPYRPKRGLYWGYVHCYPGILRVDEGWMILTRDIVDEALSKLNTTLICHPFGDQAVSLWIEDSKINVTWFWDPRIIHSDINHRNKYLKPGICRDLMGIHAIYPKLMHNLWNIMEKDNKNEKSYHIPRIERFSNQCKFSKKFDWKAFSDGYRFRPKLCKDNPNWNITDGQFIGREDA